MDGGDTPLRPIEDILHVSDRSLSDGLREIGPDVIALALKTATSELRDKFLHNMTERAAQVVRDEMEGMGPVRLADVEEAQHTVGGVVFLHEVEGEGGAESTE